MKLYILSIFLMGMSLMSFAQNIELKGKVADPNGDPLPGVSIVLENTTKGASTDFDGNFTFPNIKIGDRLTFSFIGFITKTITISNSDFLNITLEEDTQSLDEVVVVGYGTQRKKEITGAVAVVGTETIEDLKPTRVEQVLQGQVSGINITSQSGSPGSASTISIRGISTNGDNRPLILVDGNVIEDLSVLNPSDIESINVLKDATAGIYGVRAANGVILITTKTGRKSTPPKFEFSTYVGFQETSRKIPVLNATEYAILNNEAYAAGGQTPRFTDISSLGKGTDWQDEVFEKAPISNYNLGVSGGTEKFAYSYSADFLTQDGIVGGSKSNFNRFSTRFNFNWDFLKNFKANGSVIYTDANKNNISENAIGSILFNALNMPPVLSVYDENGEFTLAEELGNEVINPIAQIENTYNKTNTDRISLVGGISYNFLSNFTVESRIQFNHSLVKNRVFTPAAFYGSGKVFNNDDSDLYQTRSSYIDYTWDNFITYKNTFNEDHNLTVLLGTSIFRTRGWFSGTSFSNVAGTNLDDAAITNQSRENDPPFRTPGSKQFDSRLLSYFSRVLYDYKGKILFTGLLRRDGSSKFGPKNKFGYFPSGSLGGVLIENGDGLNFLKLRASYGIIGNDRIPSNRFTSVLDGEGDYVFDEDVIYGQIFGAISNPEIKWEKQKTLDVGFDAKLANNKVDITVDYFNRETVDLLLAPDIAGITGVGAPGSAPPIVNAGSVENKGIEFSIAYKDQLSDNFKFNVSYNFTTLKNEVLEVSSSLDYLQGGNFGVGQIPGPSRMQVGSPMGAFFGFKTDGVFQNQTEVDTHAEQQNAGPGDLRYVDTNNDGIIDSDDRVEIGDPIPDITMGLNIGFEYKNFDFKAYTFASVGNDMVRDYERQQPNTNRGIQFLSRWTGEGSTDAFHRVTTGANSNAALSDFYVEDASYIRIQNVQLGYTFGGKVKEALKIENIRIYASVNNLYTFTEYRGYDPSASSGAPIGSGFDIGFYPIPRTYLFGVNIKF